MTDYKQYELCVKVRIKETGEVGEAFESAFGYISVFVGEDRKCTYYKLEDIEFIND